jgi:hypothetical protein
MSLDFGVQKLSAFGSYGEFFVGAGANQIRAQYILTKIKPGQQGLWENQLASQMAPWREIFRIEELSFDELIQRDLDDSRVAHDLIPYLLGETGQHARFFPPILAVIVPKREGKSGIAPRYPTPTITGERMSFGDLFDFERLTIDNKLSPLGKLTYNSQRTAMVIADGQHRAMAVLALHRQLNKTWGSDPFAPYYDHIQITPEAVAHIELPVCLLFFPDLHETEVSFKEAGIDLITVCREVFTVVNRQAKQVSKSRELLLDDEDFSASMMRRTLTRFKDRDASDSCARIYSFAFGDSEADSNSQVMAGQLEYCSAVAIHKMHAAAGFALPAAFNLTKSADVTDGRNVRNPSRPIEIMNGSGGPIFQSLSRRSAKTHTPDEVVAVTELVGELTDVVMLPLFDRLRPFVAHNAAMKELFVALEDSTSKADPVQSKVRALLFDGSNNMHVFEEHILRLKERATEIKDQGKPVPSHISSQLNYCDAVSNALQDREEWVKRRRAFLLFNIDEQAFMSRDKPLVEQELKTVRIRSKAIFDAVSTQAFQIGYLMAVLSKVEALLPPGSEYPKRLAATKFVSRLFNEALNVFFGTTQAKHRTLTGYVSEPRARAFESGEQGFRGLLAAGNVRELNEKQWEFFRYVIFEIVHSKMAAQSIKETLASPESAEFAPFYLESLPKVLTEVDTLRNRYFEAAFNASKNSPDFRREMDLLEATAKANGKSPEEIEKLLNEAIAEKRKQTIEICKGHLKASLGRIDSRSQVLNRFSQTISGPTTDADAQDAESGLVEVDNELATTANLDVAIAADELRHELSSADLDLTPAQKDDDSDSE